jgi:hypothetical protein
MSSSPQFQKMSWERKNRSNVSSAAAAAGSSKQDDDAMDTTGYDEDSCGAGGGGYADTAAAGLDDATNRDAHAAGAEAAFRTLPRASSWKRG